VPGNRLDMGWKSSVGMALLAALIGMNIPISAYAQSEYTEHCQRLWPSDPDAFSLCQNLQNRNRREFTVFLKSHRLSASDLEQRANAGDRSATIAQACLTRWRPDYEMVWRCTRTSYATQSPE
jgi:hypothetical protein